MLRSSLWLLALAPSALSAQDEPLPEVAPPELVSEACDASGFVPAGWSLERQARGDLDADGQADLLMVMRQGDAANVLHNDGLGVETFDTNPRLLAVAFAAAGCYRLALQDHALIPLPDSPVMDDYLDGADSIGIARGGFFVTLHQWASAGSWSTSNTRFSFRYQQGCFRLIGYDDDWTHRGSGETVNTSVNFLTRKARIDTGSIENDTVETRWETLAPGKPPCLAEVGNGFEFDPGLRPQ